MKGQGGTHRGTKKAELRARELRRLVEDSADVIWQTDGEFRFTYVSSSVEQLLGVKKADVEGRLLWEYVAPGVRERIERLAEEIDGGGDRPREYRYDIPMLRIGGSVAMVEVNLKPIIDAGGATIGFHGVTRDITERRQAEEEIAEWKRRYEYIAAASGQIAYECCSDAGTISLGGSVEKVLGYGPRELSGHLEQWRNLIDPADREEANRRYEECLESGRPFEGEYGLRHRDGHYVRVLDRGFVVRENDGKPARMIGAMQDITEQKRTEAALRKSEAHHRTLFAAARRQAQELKLLDRVRTALARELELPLVFRTVVEGIAEAFGYTQVSLYLLQGDVLHCQHQVGYSHIIGQIPVTRGITGRVVRTGEAALVPDVRFDPDFIEAMAGIVSEVCIPLRDQGRVVGTLNVESTAGEVMGEADLRLIAALGEHVSIAIAKARLYAEARTSEERYRLLVENLGVGVMIVDPEEVILLSNPAAELVFGVPRGGLLGRNLKEFMNEENFATVLAQSLIRRTGESSTFELDISRPDGGVRHVRVTASPHRNENGEIAGAFGMFNDITEARAMEQALRQSEERLAQAQKMEAVGRLAGGIAHDFNNLLTVISGYTDMIDEEIPDSHSVKPDIRQIKKAAERAADLTAQLLAFSRKQALEPKVIDLNETVRGVQDMLPRVIGEDIELVTSLLPGAGNVRADKGQIEQVIVNLAANARDAMPSGGRLTIETDNRTLGSSSSQAHP
jgi:PAS domain S-box-containing protein